MCRGHKGFANQLDPPVLVRNTPDEPFVLKRVEAIKSGLIRGDLTPGLDLADQGREMVFARIPLNEVKHRLLFLSEVGLCQTGLRRQRQKG